MSHFVTQVHGEIRQDLVSDLTTFVNWNLQRLATNGRRARDSASAPLIGRIETDHNNNNRMELIGKKKEKNSEK